MQTEENWLNSLMVYCLNLDLPTMINLDTEIDSSSPVSTLYTEIEIESNDPILILKIIVT